ncbi:hypothetical protein AY601_4172 [Pedobacter cryoconitis]|uniref:Uncharacterized protein n=1 Tax=Pedobacter cryoconitis TaxID=188932 RepID=A0A127VID4_9SPHI|nr:hypothetical protein AY601_4172 [Pedobacter cryoconitis]
MGSLTGKFSKGILGDFIFKAAKNSIKKQSGPLWMYTSIMARSVFIEYSLQETKRVRQGQ